MHVDGCFDGNHGKIIGKTIKTGRSWNTTSATGMKQLNEEITVIYNHS